MTELLGNGYWFIMEAGDALDEGLTDALIDCPWFEDAETAVVAADLSYENVHNTFMWMREQLHMLKGVYLYNRNPLLVRWVCEWVKTHDLNCEVWVNVGDSCWHGMN
jgi:hypothetical protein